MLTVALYQPKDLSATSFEQTQKLLVNAIVEMKKIKKSVFEKAEFVSAVSVCY